MLRNPEFRRFVLLFFLVSSLLAAVGFYQNTAAGVLVVVATGIFGCLFWVFTRIRYQRIAQIADQIDLVLHDEDHLFIEELDEGELSILQSEIAKMTRRIREQNLALQREKKNLADSLADIAHQLRTPLTSVNLLLSLAGENSDEKERKRTLREIETLLLRMDDLITVLLKLSRLDADVVTFRAEALSISALIEEALRPFLVSLDLHEIKVENKVPSTLRIQGDPIWLSEAFQNILKNCIESIGEQGEIVVLGEENPLFHEIRIQDSGKGFKPADLPHVFERFYRGEAENQTGFGIGMSLSQSIIKRQGGTIKVKNHPAGGALFIIRFPK